MKIWFMRWMAYLLVPFGIVLLLLPISTQRAFYQVRETLFLGVTETLQEGSSGQKGIPVLEEHDLSPFPSLQATIEEITQDLDLFNRDWTYVIPRSGVPTEEWERFASIYVPQGKFRLGNRIFEGRISLAGLTEFKEVPFLKAGRRVAGLLLLVGGFLLFFRVYPKRGSGIYIGRKRDVIIWDTVITGFAVLFSMWFLDMVFAYVFNVSPKWKEEISWGMGTFMVVFANPFLALATSAMSTQILHINSEGIKLKGLFVMAEVKWQDMESIRITESFSPRKTAGVSSSHRLIKFLEVRGKSGRLSVMEPPSASTKRKIMEEIREKTPARFGNSIDRAEREWVSLF